MRRWTYLFVLLGICFLAIGLPYVQGGWSGRDWPEVEGKILRGDVVHHPSAPLPFTAKILYQYRIGETIFHGDHIGSDPSEFADAASAKKILEKFPMGSTVKVFYQPQHPETSLLEPALPLRWIWFMSLAGLFFALAIALGLRSRR